MKKILCIVFLTFLMSVSFAQNKINLNQGTISPKKYNQIIPYEKIKGKLMVKVLINGKSYNFLFDTGAPFAVSEKIFKELNLKTIGNVDLHDSSGKVEKMIITSLPDLQVGEIHFKDSPGIVFQEASAEILDCFGVDGIIGSNMLRNSVVQFDDRKKQITITDNAKNLSLNTDVYQELMLSPSQSNPFITIILKSGKNIAPDKILVDSGADSFYEMSLGVLKFLKEKSDVTLPVAESTGSYGWGFHGTNDSQLQYIVEVPELSFNNEKFENIRVSTTESGESRMGARSFQFGKVTLDYRKKRFYFEPYENTDKSKTSEKTWSIAPTIRDKKFVVGIIWDKNLEKEINRGDEILQFGSLDFQNKDFCESVKIDTDFQENEVDVVLKEIKTGKTKKLKIKKL
ncbi:retropepsin-like aspartic protease [Chryseobacterium zhengzhouense]|uniref:Retropepsin-like aspartic protease n=1 Tax=Chryseobacterium zhengzhouense TaxID=1636086 RepID=A0ABW2LXK0_9FLAO